VDFGLHLGPSWYVPCKQYRTVAQEKLKRPRRIMALMTADNETLLRVQDVERDVADLVYVSVSHSWTDEPFYPGLPWLVFRKASGVQLRLPWGPELKNFWVSSLCSVPDQDSEPSSRGDIHAGGMFNIAAVSPTNSTEGCLPSPRKGDLILFVSPAWAPH
jgi:hypothetical protein